MKIKVTKKLIKVFKETRKRMGMSQPDMAITVNLTRDDINDLERFKIKNISEEKRDKFVKFFSARSGDFEKVLDILGVDMNTDTITRPSQVVLTKKMKIAFKKARIDAGLSQVKLSNLANVAYATTNKIEGFKYNSPVRRATVGSLVSVIKRTLSVEGYKDLCAAFPDVLDGNDIPKTHYSELKSTGHSSAKSIKKRKVGLPVVANKSKVISEKKIVRRGRPKKKSILMEALSPSPVVSKTSTRRPALVTSVSPFLSLVGNVSGKKLRAVLALNRWTPEYFAILVNTDIDYINIWLEDGVSTVVHKRVYEIISPFMSFVGETNDARIDDLTAQVAVLTERIDRISNALTSL